MHTEATRDTQQPLPPNASDDSLELAATAPGCCG